jgi:hypothetical protein
VTKKHPPYLKILLWTIPALLLLAVFLVPGIVRKSGRKAERIQVQSPELTSISGQLIWFDESPVPDAMLSVERFDKKFEAKTDSEGFFDLKVSAEMIGKQVDLKIKFDNQEKTETIRLIPENFKRYTLSR